MWYRYHHRPRRWRGGFFFPFPFIFFFLFLGWGHGHFGLLTVLLPAIILLAFGAIIRNRRLGRYQQPNQNNQFYGAQQNTYSDPNYYYQQPYTPYTPYQQGYQPEQPSEASQEGRSSYSYPQQEQQYQEYEQPQAQYPEQMPPPVQ